MPRFDELGLKPGDHLVTVLQNRWEAATLHWACQFAGIIITPVNWRATATRSISASRMPKRARSSTRTCPRAGVAAAQHAKRLPRIARGRCRPRRRSTLRDLLGAKAADAKPRANAEAWSVMLYTSGTTARPKGVPRRHRAERAAALAHVAQNLYRRGERTLGVMPLYHTMGVRSLLAMSLIGGTFVCLPRFDVGARCD